MADADCPTLPAGDANQFVELLANRFLVRLIVQKHIPPAGLYQVLARHLFGQGQIRGSAVDKKESVLPQRAHQPAHRCRIGGQQTPHVVIDARHMGHGLQPLA